MFSIIAILFPLLITLIIFKIFPINIDHSFENVGNPQIRDLTKKEEFYCSISIIALIFVFGTLLWFVQYKLFKMPKNPDTLFYNRTSDMKIYSGLPSLFLGIIFGGVGWFHFTQWYLGRKKFYHILLAKQRGLQLIKQYKWLPKCAFLFAIVFSLLNWSVYNTFLIVDQNQIHFSKWQNLSSTHIGINEIKKLNLYSLRRAPNGKINKKPYVEVEFKDGFKLDTFYLIEEYHIPLVLEALKKAKKENLLIDQVKGLRES